MRETFRWRSSFFVFLLSTLIFSGAGLALATQENEGGKEAVDNDELNQEAIRILTSRCYNCHGGSSVNAGVDVLEPDSLFANRGKDNEPNFLVIPGAASKSILWRLIEEKIMPEEASKEAAEMTDEERETIRKWIDAGAQYPVRRSAVRVSREKLFGAATRFLEQFKPAERGHYRFFTFDHLSANVEVSEQSLRYHRAALAKVLNSLVYKSSTPVQLLEVPDTSETLYAVDLRQLEWTKDNQWRAISDQNPYGVSLEYAANAELRKAYIKLGEALGGESQPIIRGDWFVVYGTQHPLYTKLLDLPPSLEAFQERLGVDFKKNFVDGKVARAGFAKSGVSRQNRLIERHEGKSGYVWLSYDFKPRRAQGDLIEFPLGPEFPNNPFFRQSFMHDGGELIFRLPNGLQGYMLVYGDGSRLDGDAPTEIVFDSSGVTGTMAIRNGISCMNCHSRGMISGFRDDVRAGLGVGGDALKFVERIYPTQAEMNVLIEADRQAFMTAERAITSPYLQPQDKAEPVGKVAVQYYKTVTFEAALCELGMSDGQQLRSIIAGNSELQGMGFGRFEQQPPSNIQRIAWESGRDLSRWQRLYQAVERGSMPLKAKDLLVEEGR